jgi:hypothetical protein
LPLSEHRRRQIGLRVQTCFKRNALCSCVSLFDPRGKRWWATVHDVDRSHHLHCSISNLPQHRQQRLKYGSVDGRRFSCRSTAPGRYTIRFKLSKCRSYSAEVYDLTSISRGTTMVVVSSILISRHILSPMSFAPSAL